MMKTENTSKRRKRGSIGRSATDEEGTSSSSLSLSPVVICLTGYSQDEKERIHRGIENLGGKYTRSLDSSVNTHLMAKKPEGPKYLAAIQYADAIHVVNSVWLEDCIKQKAWVEVNPEKHCHEPAQHGFREETKSEYDNVNNDPKTSQPQPLEMEKLEKALGLPHDDMDAMTLFSPCQFILIGFDEDSQEYLLLTRLIRKGMGRISWDFTDAITHVVLADGKFDETVKIAATLMQNEHPNAPAVVTARWLVQCWEEKQLFDANNPQFWPGFLSNQNPQETQTNAQKTTKSTTQPISKTSLFRGSLFALLRVAPPDWAVDYSTKVLEELVVSNGGQILNNRVVDALKVDKAATSSDSKPKRLKCFVVFWGGASYSSSLSLYPTLEQVKRLKLCDLMEVSPTWVQTCCTESKLISRSTFPTFFKPLNWLPMRLFSGNSDNEKKAKELCKGNVVIAVSGFKGSMRSAIAHWIAAIGASYDDSLSRERTTHLICHESSINEPKCQKALQWKVKVVSLDWLVHISQHGIDGENGSKGEGCEKSFPVEAPSES